MNSNYSSVREARISKVGGVAMNNSAVLNLATLKNFRLTFLKSSNYLIHIFGMDTNNRVFIVSMFSKLVWVGDRNSIFLVNVNLNTQSWFNFKSHFLLILEVLNEFTPLKRGLQGASKGVWRA